MTLGVGVIGCGRAAEDLHLPALGRSSTAAAVAVCDPDDVTLARVADRYGIPRRYAVAHDLLADPTVTAVIVCTPPATHAEIALAAIAAGKHVLVEKPLAVDRDDLDRLVAAERNTSVITAIGLNLRCHRLVEEARRIVASGTLGPISTLRTTWTAGFARGRPLPEWRHLRRNGGGVVHEMGTHHVDLWRFLLGDEIVDVTAIVRDGGTEDEAAVLTARSARGTLVSGVLSDRTPDSNEIDIVGRDGRIRFSLYRADSFEITSHAQDYGVSARARGIGRRAAAVPTVLRAARRGGDFITSYDRQLERLVAAIGGSEEPAATWGDGLLAARIIEEALDATGPSHEPQG